MLQGEIMLLFITSSCRMQCTHCLSDCKPDGVHMSMEVLNDAIKFIKKIRNKIVIVSGGEPTDHLQFLDIMERLVKEFAKPQLSIASNGMFF